MGNRDRRKEKKSKKRKKSKKQKKKKSKSNLRHPGSMLLSGANKNEETTIKQVMQVLPF